MSGSTIIPLRLDPSSARFALNLRINCSCYQRFIYRAGIALRLPIKNWVAINMNIRLSSTAPEFHVHGQNHNKWLYEIDKRMYLSFTFTVKTTTNGCTWHAPTHAQNFPRIQNFGAILQMIQSFLLPISKCFQMFNYFPQYLRFFDTEFAFC